MLDSSTMINVLVDGLDMLAMVLVDWDGFCLDVSN